MLHLRKTVKSNRSGESIPQIPAKPVALQVKIQTGVKVMAEAPSEN